MRSNTENAIDEGPLTTFVLQRQTVFESDRPFRRFPKKKLNENASLEWTAKSPNLQQQDISELWDTMEMLEQPVPHRGRKRPQPKHTVSDSDSVATTGYQGSHQSTSADDSDSDSVTTTGYPISNQSTSTVDAAEDRKFGGHLASQRELCEPGMNGEPLDRSFPVLAGQSQESSSRVAASGEKKQKCVSDSTTTTQSLELTDPQSDEVNPLNATSGVKGKASNGLSISGGGTPQLPETDASPPVPSAAISLRRRLTGALKGVQPVHIASRHSVTQIPIQTVEARLIGKNCYLALKEEVHKSLAERWNESIHQRLRQNVEAVIQGMGLQPTEMAVNVGLSLVGPKVGEMLHLLPTIVISCAHKKAKTKIEGLLNSGQLDYLREFACPHEVCIQGRDPKHRDRFFAHTDSSEEVDPLGEDISPYDLSLQRQKFLKFAVEQVTELRSACGLKIQFSYSIQDEHHDDYFGSEMSEHKRWMTARIGGNIYIGEKAFAMTTAHTFLFHELGEESDASSGSDSISGGNLDTKFDRQRPDHNANSIQAKTTLRMERGRLHGCFGFCDHGRRFDRQDLIPKLPGSDWCILSIDSINSLTNCYRTENEAGDVSEVTVDEIGPGEIAEPGDVHILNSPEKPILAFMTQTMASIYFGGKSLNVRRLISERPLSTGLSGSWVVRGKQLLGHLIGGNELEKTMYMLGIQDTKRAIEQVTGGKMCLKPTNSAEVFVEEHPQLDRPEPAPRISNVWYEDPKTGDIYQDRIDSKGRSIRTWRRWPKEASRAESPPRPQSRRNSVYSPGRDIDNEFTSRHQRKPSHEESDHREPYQEVDEYDYADEPAEAYSDSSQQALTGDEFESYPSSSQVSSSRDLSPNSLDPRAEDPLAKSSDALHVSSDEYFTHSTLAAPATRDWQSPTVSSHQEKPSFVLSYRDSSQQISSSHDYYARQTFPEPQTKQQRQNRVIKGTAGDSERIDPSYKVRNKDWKEFFRIGRVFSTLWTDSLGDNAGRVDPTFVSEVKYGERVYSKIRRFIVVREGNRSVSCLPVTSYANQGIRKSGIRLDEHGFIYSRNRPKRVDEMCSRPLKLDLAQGAMHLKDPALVNYGKVYNVETNVKVKNVGMVDEDSKDTLLRYFRKVFSGTEDSGSGGHTPRASEAVLLGVGAEFNSYPASTSGSGYAFASTVSGYPPSSTVYGAPHDSGSQAGSSSYYNPSSLYETSASASYPPTSNPYGMGSTPYSGPSDHSQSSIHSQTQYASTQVAASSHELTYNSDNTMDPSHRYSTDQYPSSNRDSHYGQGSSAAVPLNAPGYSSGFYDQQPSQYPSTVTGSSSYPQPGGGYGPSAEPYPPPGGYDSRPPHSGSALPSAYDDDIDLSVDPAREETLARKRRENRSDRRRR